MNNAIPNWSFYYGVFQSEVAGMVGDSVILAKINIKINVKQKLLILANIALLSTMPATSGFNPWLIMLLLCVPAEIVDEYESDDEDDDEEEVGHTNVLW